MHIVRLSALRALRGDFGTLGNPMDFAPRAVGEGESFTTDDRQAEELEARGLAERYRAPRPPEVTAAPAAPENKMIPAAPENKATELHADATAEASSAPLFYAPQPAARRIARGHRNR